MLKLQQKDNQKLNCECSKIKQIGQSAAKSRNRKVQRLLCTSQAIGDGNVTLRRYSLNIYGNIEQFIRERIAAQRPQQKIVCSVWTGDIENAFFSAEKFDRHRILALPELEASNKKGKDTYYVMGVDVGRIGCTSEVCIFKVAPNGLAGSMKSLVDVYTFDAEHFEDQAIHLKRLFYRYKARIISIDANGLGVGLIDYMVKQQIDPDSGEVLPPFGVENDTDKLYKKFETSNTEPDALFLIKANAPINTEAYSYAQTQMQSGKIKFLVDEATAKERLMATKRGQEMSLSDRNEYLKPYVQTTMLREQLLNLVEENEGVNIILKQSSRKIKKDKVSAFIYGLYYIKNDDERRKKRKRFRASDMMFFS